MLSITRSRNTLISLLPDAVYERSLRLQFTPAALSLLQYSSILYAGPKTRIDVRVSSGVNGIPARITLTFRVEKKKITNLTTSVSHASAVNQ